MVTSALDKIRSDQKPKIVTELPERIRHWGPPGASMAISTPREVDGVVRAIPKGKLATVNTIREVLAKRNKTTIACPVTTGIFIHISAKAAAEEEQMGTRKVAPWWRVLKSDGKLNERMPGGLAEHRRRLEAEGFKVVPAGKKGLMVDGFEKKLAKLS
jgi:alkylated DNA nucleotide flippase Atl1